MTNFLLFSFANSVKSLRRS